MAYRGDAFRPGLLSSCCPTWLGAYVAMHVDTISKMLNHLLYIMLACDVFVFVASWSVSFLPVLGFNTVMVAFLLCLQTVCVWLILNNHRVSSVPFLAPTDFMVGVALGITVGAAVLAFILSSSYRQQCKAMTTPPPSFRHLLRAVQNTTAKVEEANDRNPPGSTHERNYEHETSNTTTAASTTAAQQSQYYYADTDPVGNFACVERRGSMTAISFWSGLLVWLNIVCCLLLAVGRSELSSSQQQHNQYEEVGPVTMADDYEDAFRRINQGGGGNGGSGAQSSSSSTPATFPGDFPSGGNTTGSTSTASPGAANYSSANDIRRDALRLLESTSLSNSGRGSSKSKFKVEEQLSV